MLRTRVIDVLRRAGDGRRLWDCEAEILSVQKRPSRLSAAFCDEARDRVIRFRIGINVGDAIPDEADLHWDAVNVAQRLQALSLPGGICVSRSVRDHVHGRLGLTFNELGLLNQKISPNRLRRSCYEPAP